MSDLEMKVEALMRCVPREAFEKALAEVSGQMAIDLGPVDSDQALRREIEAIMVDIGVPAHIKGYRYLVWAVQLAVKDETMIDAITFGLYPAVAEQFDTSSSKVERAIRHAIEVAWDRGDLDTLQKYFGNTICRSKGKPTNGEFIARVANIVRDRMM